MSNGILEVRLIDAEKLRDKDFFGKMDPYVLICYGSQERKSKVARGQGRHPVWNQTFTFKTEYTKEANDLHKISFKIMDKDTFSKDDFVGESALAIYVKDVVSLSMENGKAELLPHEYRVVLANKTYYGEIRVGVTFTRKVEDGKDAEFGGWKQSSFQ